MMFRYKGDLFPQYLKEGNACRFIAPAALQFCKGRGLDVGCGAWPLPGAEGVDLKHGGDAMNLPGADWDFIFSSHMLEHSANPIATLGHWKSRLKPGGVLFLHLPHPAMHYWKPQHCSKHLHSWPPAAMVEIVTDLGFIDVINSERDLSWSFSVVGRKPYDCGLSAAYEVGLNGA